MTNHKPPLFRLLGTIVIVVALVLPVLLPNAAQAAQITARRLTLQPGATDGGSKPGGVVDHFFEFTLPGGNSVGSIQFLYCTTASGACTTPAGLDTTSSTLGSETGATGFVIDTADVNGSPYLTRTAAAVGANTPVTYQLQTITNPTTTNQTFYVRISTFTSTDTTGSALDTGTVAASTATPIVLNGTMPESLVFCTGGTVGLTAGVPDCSTASSGSVSFNQLFSPTDTATATSQMAASTNAGSGYAITVAGPTLTSGSNTISAMTSTGFGIRGTSQFGLNLKANTVTTSTPAVGTEVAAAPNGTNYKGQAAANYNTVDQFKFNTGDTVANSANGGAGASDAQIFTVSYVVNVPGSQAAGTYTTTLTYVCTPTF